MKTLAKKPSIWQRLKLDSFFNAYTGLGTGQDKRVGGVPNTVSLVREDFDQLYRGSDMGAVLVEALPDEMFREGWHVKVKGDPELSAEINKYIEESGVNHYLKQMFYWARQTGGSATIPLCDDGAIDLAEPLDYNKIKSIKGYTVLNRWELYPQFYYGDPLAPNYGYPSILYLQQLFGLPQEIAQVGDKSNFGSANAVSVPQSNSTFMQETPLPFPAIYSPGEIPNPSALKRVHESRLLFADGVPVTRNQRIKNNGWGDSVFTRVFEVLRDYEMSWAGVTHLLSDFAQGVWKIEGLNELMVSGDDDVVQKLMMKSSMLRSMVHDVVVDAGGEGKNAEEYTRHSTQLTGLPEIMQQLALKLAAAARMPVSLLLGQAPAGLNATGDSDIRWYYDRIKSKQNEELLPVLKRYMKMVFATKDGPTGGVEPESYQIVFNNLWQLSTDQEATRRLQISQADVAYINAGVVTPSEVANSRFGDETYQGDSIHLDEEARAAEAPETEDHLQGQMAEIEVKKGNNPDGTKPEPEPNAVDVQKEKNKGKPASK
jgi:hypothetical protein